MGLCLYIITGLKLARFSDRHLITGPLFKWNNIWKTGSLSTGEVKVCFTDFGYSNFCCNITCVDAIVSFEMRRLEIGLAAFRVIAHESSFAGFEPMTTRAGLAWAGAGTRELGRLRSWVRIHGRGKIIVYVGVLLLLLLSRRQRF